MALTPDELEQVKYFLGYTGVTSIAIGYIDFPAIFTTVLQNNLSTWAEGQIRSIVLVKLAAIEENIDQAQGRYKALKAGKVALNPDEHRALLRLKNFWVERLEVVTGIKRRSGGKSSLALY